MLKQFTQTQFWVLWDGLRSPQTMHCTLIEKIDQGQASALTAEQESLE